ncbi:MAG: hypothetical protein LUG52_07100 [Clostridia bacterium]|nr:hypothetical protein [Clostridia bacterium]
MPKKMPTTAEKQNAATMIGICCTIGTLGKLIIIVANSLNTIPSKIPIVPPTQLIIDDSIKNCDRIVLVLAPTAFLMPISSYNKIYR